ncbi:MAG: acyltransferase [Planctomycetaceae bacterium]|nr:acyltransferase [Planctomycetaceae bacterium]
MKDVELLTVDQRISVLDGFRGLAILMVTVYRFADVSLTSEVIGRWPSQLFYFGASGVDLFFVLSGFLITGILLDAKCRTGSYFSRFYFRRGLRIFPLYFAMLGLVFFVIPSISGDQGLVRQIPGDQIHLWLYTMNLYMAWMNNFCYGPLNHFWSLAVEEQYYLVWPVIVFFLPSKTLLRFSLTALLILTSLRIGFSIAEFGSVAEKVFTLFRLDGLLLGSMAAIVTRDLPTWRNHIGVYRLSLAILFLMLVATLPLGSNDYTIRFTLVSGAAVALLLASLSGTPKSIEKILLDNAPMRSLGKYSYAMYVFQLPMVPLLAPWVSPASLTTQIGSPIGAGIVYVVLMFFLTYALAIFSWYGFEMWFLKLRDYWPNGSVDPPREPNSEKSPTSSVTTPKFMASSRRGQSLERVNE